MDHGRQVTGCAGGTREHESSPTQARVIRVRAIKPDAPNQPGVRMSTPS
jgi:hypothetical protein